MNKDFSHYWDIYNISYNKHMKRTIIIDEAKESEIIETILESAFIPNVQQVIEIKDFLDKNIKKKIIPTINKISGNPDLEINFVLCKNGIELQVMTPRELRLMLDDEFQDRIKIKNEEDKKRFLEQVITDWCSGKIKNGLLSVNKI